VPFAAVAGNVLAALNNGWGVRFGQEHRVRLQAKCFAVAGTEVFPAARKTDVLVQPCILTESKVLYCIWVATGIKVLLSVNTEKTGKLSFPLAFLRKLT
jgi:hypothetical protein